MRGVRLLRTVRMPKTSVLLLLRYKLAGGSVQRIVDRQLHRLAVGSHGHAGDADYFSIALIGFFECGRADALHRDTGGTGIALIRCIRAIQLRGIGLPGRGSHGQRIPVDFVSKRQPVI